MRSLKIDSCGDLVISGNSLLMTDSTEDILQSVRIILGTRLNEFFFDENLGLDHDNLLGKNINLEFLKQDMITSVLEQEERVVSVKSIDFDLVERHLNIKIVMTAIENTEPIESEVRINVG